MAEASILPSRKKLILSAVLLFLVIGLVAGFLIIDNMVKERLPKIFGDRVTISDFSYSLWERSVEFSDLSFESKEQSDTSKMNIFAKANRAKVSGFSILDLLENHKISISSFLLDSLDVRIYLPEIQTSVKEKQKINLFITEVFTQIEVDLFDLTHSNLTVLNLNDSSDLMEVNRFSISAESIEVDTASIQHVFPLSFKQNKLSIDSIWIQLNQEYELSAKNFQIADTSFWVEDLSIISSLSKSEFSRIHPYEKAQIDLTISKMSAKNLLWDIDNNNYVSFNSENLDVQQARLEVYKDKNPPQPPAEVKPLLNTMIRDLPFDFTIDTMFIRDSFIQYEILPVDAASTGKVFFDNLYMSAYNLTNNKVQIDESPISILDIQANFMSKGALKTVIKLDMASSIDKFETRGSLGPMAFNEVNQVLTPVAGFDSEGDVVSLEFSFSGDDYSSTGSVDFAYDNLKVKVLDKNREKEWFKSVFGNLALNSSNQKDDLNFNSGEIYFIRFQNKDFFNYQWNSIKVGLLDTVLPLYQNPDKNEVIQGPKMKSD